MTVAGSRTRRSLWPFATAGASLVMLMAAGVLWSVSPGRRGVPATPLELSIALSALGSFVLWCRPGQRVAALIAGTGVAFSVVTVAAAGLDHVGTAHGPAAHTALAVGWLSAALPVPWLLLVLWFPDGRFMGARWRRTFLVLALLALVIAAVGYLFGPAGQLPSIMTGIRLPPHLAGPYGAQSRGWLVSMANALSVLPLVGLAALISRYRHGNVQVRQQIRWVLFAVIATIAVTLVAQALDHGPAGAAAVGTVLADAAQPLPAVAITVALLRYRLWDIEIVISRTVVYAALWAALSALLLMPALVSGYLVGGRGTVTAVVAALLVVLAFQPLTRRLQRTVDNLMFGARRRGLEQLARAGDAMRAVGDVDDIAARVVGIVQDALAVPWVMLWLHVRTDSGSWLRPVGASGVDAVAVRLSAAVTADLSDDQTVRVGDGLPNELVPLLPAPVGVLTSLLVGDELVGVLASGARAGDPLGERDLAAIDRFAGELALGLRGLRLDAELRHRIDEIEEQAEQLRTSRQRLVRAQDDERRRIERDLHDGVQQQLVALASRLRKFATAVDHPARAECERLAADAEDAVFALQALARGIFPGVLADHGLDPALRAHAGRSPLPVRVEIAPSLTGRRFDAEVETALYFVALEALTNVTKHAPEANVTLALRTDDAATEVILEVHDDGPGLPPAHTRREGSGLLNMRDRIAAIGGRLSIDSRPGAGTWVRAVAPLTAAILPFHAVQVDSRR